MHLLFYRYSAHQVPILSLGLGLGPVWGGHMLLLFHNMFLQGIVDDQMRFIDITAMMNCFRVPHAWVYVLQDNASPHHAECHELGWFIRYNNDSSLLLSYIN
ncbi:hypothetical protein ACJX0J_030191 [Zea mays]